MTGEDFDAHLKAAGFSQIAFARAMGVHRTTIATRCAPGYSVEPFWVYALAGIVAARSAGTVVAILGDLGKPVRAK